MDIDINQLLSSSTATLLSPSKLPRLQSDSISGGSEQPLVIPLGGAASLCGSPALSMVSLPLLNQQLLVPLAAFQTTKESSPLMSTALVSSFPSSSLSIPSKAVKSQSLIPGVQHQQLGESLGLNLCVGKDKNLLPLFLDRNQHQILNQPSIVQPVNLSQVQATSILNQNISVQYNDNNSNETTTELKEKHNLQTSSIKHEFNLKSKQKSIGSCPSTTITAPLKIDTKSHGMSHNDKKNSTSNLNFEWREDGQQIPNSETSQNTSNGQSKIDADNLSKIISSLPPGWKVVGLTNFPGTEAVQSTPVLETYNNNDGCDKSTCNISSHHPHHHCSIPDVVSVDLNVPTTMSSLLNDKFDCKKIDDITLPINLSDISNAKARNAVNKKEKLSPPSPPSSSSLIQDAGITTTGLDQFVVHIKQEVDDDDTLTTSTISQQLSPPKIDIDIVKNEWKVIGLTTSASLLQTSMGFSNPIMQTAALPSPVFMTPAVGIGLAGEDGQKQSRSPKATTILNIPSLKLVQQSGKTPNQQKFPTSVDSTVRKGNDEIRWTIVGVTMASFTGTTNTVCNAQDSVDSILPSNVKINSNGNNDDAKANCKVTNSQERPVCSSESENAPLSSEVGLKGIDSLLSKDQWKVVGITQGNEYQNQTAQIGYHVPIPLIPQPQQPSPLLVTSIGSTSVTNSVNLGTNSDNTTMTSPSFLSSNGLLQNLIGSHNDNSSTFPLVKPTLSQMPLTLPSHCNSLLEQQQLLQLIQNQLHLQQQHQEQRQLLMNHIQSQLTSQNQNPFVSNALNEWNLVNLLSNIPSTSISADSLSDVFNANKKDKESCQTDRLVENKNVKEHNIVPTNKEPTVLSDSDRAQADQDYSDFEYKRSRRSKDKDIATKYTKKNTVSHLLKLKRMKMKQEDEDDGSLSPSDQDSGYDIDKAVKQNKDKITFLTRGEKALRSRPLHSYAGNRKIFTKSLPTKKDSGKDKLNLRSGYQIPVKEISSDDNSYPKEIKKEPFTHAVVENAKLSHESLFQNVTRSAARKRKLKIPRKMIADLDYQPFDSSSDSN